MIDATPPACSTWNFQLNNYWMESLDYRYHPIHVNKGTAKYLPDNSVRIIVAAEDPKLKTEYNWIDTCGHTCGTMCFRWVKPVTTPPPPIHPGPFHPNSRWLCLVNSRTLAGCSPSLVLYTIRTQSPSSMINDQLSMPSPLLPADVRNSDDAIVIFLRPAADQDGDMLPHPKPQVVQTSDIARLKFQK